MSKKADKCTREMMGYSALCSLQPKGKIASCLKRSITISRSVHKGYCYWCIFGLWKFFTQYLSWRVSI